jgi:putative acetyltransferase
MAVTPTWQHHGIGSALVRESLRLAKERHWQAVIVVGHPSFYPRFGFSSALAERLAAPFRGEAFMALELESGALAGAAGSVIYPPAFGIAD